MIYFETIKSKIKNIFTQKQSYTLKKLTDVINDGYYRIDENTYQDLLMAEINSKLNHTSTTFGDELFDHWSRNIKEYNSLISVQEDTVKLQKSNKAPFLIHILKKTGQQKRGNIISDLWDGFEIDSFLIRNIIPILIINITAMVLLSIFLSKYIFVWIVLFLIVNLTVYISTNPLIARFSGSINYLLNGISAIKRIKKRKLDLLSIEKPDCKKFAHLQWCTLLFKDGLGGMGSEDPFSILLDYLRTFLCLEALSFNITSRFILKNISDVRTIIYYLGYYDCIVNNVMILENYETSFSQIEKKKEISFTDLYHPLIKEPVKQSKKIHSGLIITGLNMAGKSTFMRTIGINQLLATSFGLSFSAELKTDILRIITSFRINDALLENKSRYFAEAERLASIITHIKEEKCLCIIDEILSGTNSQDRIYGSIEILKRLSKNQESIVISATHDVDIANSLSNRYELGYFDGEIKDKKIFFDYILKPGVVENRNGLLILNSLGINI